MHSTSESGFAKPYTSQVPKHPDMGWKCFLPHPFRVEVSHTLIVSLKSFKIPPLIQFSIIKSMSESTRRSKVIPFRLKGCVPSQTRCCEITCTIKPVVSHANLSEVLKNVCEYQNIRLEIQIVIACHRFASKLLPNLLSVFVVSIFDVLITKPWKVCFLWRQLRVFHFYKWIKVVILGWSLVVWKILRKISQR